VLSRGIDPNRTINFSPERLSFCGANFCLTRNLTAAIRNATRGDDDFFNSTGVDSGVDELPRPSQENVYILFGILGGCIILAGGAISLFVDKPPKYFLGNTVRFNRDYLKLLILTGNWKQWAQIN